MNVEFTTKEIALIDLLISNNAITPIFTETVQTSWDIMEKIRASKLLEA
jgi:hypothetical protein